MGKLCVFAFMNQFFEELLPRNLMIFPQTNLDAKLSRESIVSKRDRKSARQVKVEAVHVVFAVTAIVNR